MPHNLLEELLLLSIHDDKGTVVSQVAETLRYGLAGAMLADLALAGRISLADGKRVVVVDPAPTGDDLLDEALQVIQTADRSKKISYWINTLSNSPRKLIKRLAEKLVAQGILRDEEKRYLWVIPYAAYPQADASAKYWIKIGRASCRERV